jgi:hypothetical protein
MAKITDYATLKTEIANTLNRSDLTNDLALFIQGAEDRIRGDDRLRKLQYRGTFNASADGNDLPTDFAKLDALYHDGPTYYGPISIVGANELPLQKARLGQDTGVPRYAALVDGKVYWAPEPDATYALIMTYYRDIVPLSDSVTTNWVIDQYPHLYLYAALSEAEGFLKHWERSDYWDAKFERLAT